MANPQKENGYTAISNEVLEKLILFPFPEKTSAPQRLLLFVIRKTWGYQKKSDCISLTQFEKGINSNRPSVVHWLDYLVKAGLLVKVSELSKKGYIWEFNKNWELWKWGVKASELVKVRPFTSKGALTATSKGALTHKRKKEIYTKEIMGEAPRNDVNELIDFFRTTVNPHINFGNKTERKASEDLIKTYGLERVKEAIKFLEEKRKTNKYIPLVTTPYELWTKWAKIKQYLTSKKPKVWRSTSALLPSLQGASTN